MRISDWSSYLCSSDLNHANAPVPRAGHLDQRRKCRPWVASEVRDNQRGTRAFLGSPMQIVVGEQLSALRRGRAHDQVCVQRALAAGAFQVRTGQPVRSEEHTSELQSLMRISYAVFCLKNKTNKRQQTTPNSATTDIRY